MKIIREVRNALDGKYSVRDDEQRKEKTNTVAGGGFREEESRVVRKLLDLGLAVPQNDTKSKRGR